MRICIIDLEATCGKDKFDHEIIEIGALICDDSCNEIYSTYQNFVKPMRNPILTPFCRSLTTITQEQVDMADGYITVMGNFTDWLQTNSVDNDINNLLFASWGEWDKKQFKKDCIYHQIPYPFDDNHLNIKQLFLEKMDRQRAGVKKALRILGMKFEGVPHRALEDVINIHRILKKLQKLTD